MAFYTNNIINSEIQPVSHQKNYRTEFRLEPDNLYLSNLRLINIGVTGKVGNKLNQLVGALGVIKSISLLDGNETLDTLNNFNQYAGFRCYNRTNDENISQNYRLKKNYMGFINLGSNLDYVGGPAGFVQVGALRNPSELTDNVDTTPTMWVSLKDYFPFLEGSEYVPTSIYKNFRIVIEYENDVDNITPEDTDAFETTIPFLVADMIDNDNVKSQILQNYNGVRFSPIENSRVVLNAIVPTVGNPNPTQSQTFTINAFNDKTIERLLLVKEPVSTSSDTIGRLGSIGQYLESTQYNINGANLLQGAGLTSRNMTLAMLYDLYGDCNNIAPNGYLAESENYITDLDLVNRLEYTAVHIGDYVQNFQLQYGRTGQFDAAEADQSVLPLNQRLNLQLYAEVRKEISVNSDGSYAIAYV